MIQISNALTMAVCCNGVFETRPRKDLPKLILKMDFSEGYETHFIGSDNASVKACKWRGNDNDLFYGRSPGASCTFDAFNLFKFVTLQDFKHHSCEHCGNEYDESLMIHIRSGDIFSENPHHSYKQPPVAFYEKVFERRYWPQIIFVTSVEDEELINPIWFYYEKQIARHKVRINSTFRFQQTTNLADELRYAQSL
jgi:hypothetical protein